MPDTRRHRGPHPGDAALFAEPAHARLRDAARDVHWLLDRGYAIPSVIKLVGDRFELRERQRKAVQRCACSAADRERRVQKIRLAEGLRGAAVWIDGFNVLTSVEAALGGGVLLLGRDGFLRDMASMHGSYRRVEETVPALHAIADVLAARQIGACRWLLDAPVSNSGRLRARILKVAEERGLLWCVDVVPDPDRELVAVRDVVVASADAGVLDAAVACFDLARATVERAVDGPWLVDLAACHPG